MMLVLSPIWGQPIDAEIRTLLLKYYPQQRDQIEQLKSIDEIQSIDPYARYLPAESPLPSFGIGAELAHEEQGWYLIPFSHSALFQMGFKRKLRLLQIEDQSVADWNAEQIQQALLGEKNSVVKIRVQHGEQIDDLFITRVPIQASSFEILDKNEVRIRYFKTRETCLLFGQFLSSYPVDQPLTIDLRYASGGDLYEALDCASLFLPAGTVLIYLKDHLSGQEEMITAPLAASVFEQKPHLILKVGRGTASAAEVFAGILQYYGRALLIGNRTYGKCVSQTNIPLANGAILWLSNKSIYFPDHSSCNRVGLKALSVEQLSYTAQYLISSIKSIMDKEEDDEKKIYQCHDGN